MITRRVAAALLGISVVGGVAAGVAADAMTSDRPAASKPPATSTAAPTPTPAARVSASDPTPAEPRVEVREPVLVSNQDGSATLSAVLVNRTEDPIAISDALAGDEDDLDRPILLVHGPRSLAPLEPGVDVRIGGVGDAYRIRSLDPVPLGTKMTISLDFSDSDGNGKQAGTVSFRAGVVARSAQYANVANNGPNPDITVHDAKIVVVPGQEKAYIGGYVTSTIEDVAYFLPTAVRSDGRSVAYRHQTATGGPYGLSAIPGRRTYLGQAPYLESALEGGDADYVLATDVSVGETVNVRMRFPSGDVVAPFKVVRGTVAGLA